MNGIAFSSFRRQNRSEQNMNKVYFVIPYIPFPEQSQANVPLELLELNELSNLYTLNKFSYFLAPKYKIF